MTALLAPTEVDFIEHPWPAETPAHSPALAPEPAPFRRKSVLIVDDDALVRASLASVLECEGYEVHGAADGQAALRSAVEHHPDLVLLDLNMPIMDGWSAFTKLDQTRPLIPVVVITARPHQYKHAVRFGVDAFMEKPLNIPVLLRAIRKLTFEPEARRTKRLTNPGFVTRFLDSQTPNYS